MKWWVAAADLVKPQCRTTANSTGWPTEPLPAEAHIREGNGGAAEDEGSHRNFQHERQRGHHDQIQVVPQGQVAPRLAVWLGVLELVRPDGVLLLELALQVFSR